MRAFNRSASQMTDMGGSAALQITEFNLLDIGVDQDRLIEDIAASFDQLSLDVYEKRRQELEFLMRKLPAQQHQLNAFYPNYFCEKSSLQDIAHLLSSLSIQDRIELDQIGAVRYRSIAKFKITFANSPSPQIKRVNAGTFIQKTSVLDDFRSLPRFFVEAAEDVTENIGILKILHFVASAVKKQHPGSVQNLVVTLHQVCVFVDQETPFHLPDGVHQDGVDYIVSAIPLILRGAMAPVSTIYDSSLKPVFETRLGLGRGLLHDDKHYWHSVAPVCAIGTVGRRGTIGLDILVNA